MEKRKLLDIVNMRCIDADPNWGVDFYKSVQWGFNRILRITCHHFPQNQTIGNKIEILFRPQLGTKSIDDTFQARRNSIRSSKKS